MMFPRLLLSLSLIVAVGCSSFSMRSSAARPIFASVPGSAQPTYVGRPSAPLPYRGLPRHVPSAPVRQPQVPQNNERSLEWGKTERKIDDQERPAVQSSPDAATKPAPAKSVTEPSVSQPLDEKSGNAGWDAIDEAAGQPKAKSSDSEKRPHSSSPARRTSSQANGGPTPNWQIAGYSQQRQPISLRRIGSGEHVVMVLASLYGNEADTIAFVNRLAEQLTSREMDSRDTTLLLIPNPNPDGWKEGTLTNARGVNLDRNFPSRSFAARRTTLTGPTAASEVETRTVMNLLDDFRPHRVVHVRSGSKNQLLATMNRSALEHWTARSGKTGLLIGSYDGVFQAGSLAEYVSRELETEMLEIELPSQALRGEIALTPEITDLIVGPAPTREITNSQRPPVPSEAKPAVSDEQDLFAPYAPPVTLTGQIESPVPDGKKGYVEILPPPPEYSDPENGEDAKYYELPPPIE